MTILFHLGHPAHYHLFKNSIKTLKNEGHNVHVAIKKKDVLEQLLISDNIEFHNILPDGRGDSKFKVAFGLFKQTLALLKLSLKIKPTILVGTSVSISYVGKLLNIPSLNVNEDDAEIVPLYSKLAYPWATKIMAPHVCSVGKFDDKKIPYNGYHELAYLHPEDFTPNKDIAFKYVDSNSEYFLIRFAKLTAHHDDGVKGISDEFAMKIISKLEKRGKVYITSERELSSNLEKYRININPIDMHHVMAFASLYMGDSQTMAAEAAVLGVPFIRYNDFVDRISYLRELEEKYVLGFGIKPPNEEKLLDTIDQIFSIENYLEAYQQRRTEMLKNSIRLTPFIIENIKKLSK